MDNRVLGKKTAIEGLAKVVQPPLLSRYHAHIGLNLAAPDGDIILQRGSTAVDRKGRMPTIFFYDPELDKEKKKEPIKSFTETASRLTGIDKLAFVVYIRPTSRDNVGVGGELLSERLPQKKT